jgi:hypothetical protein
MFFRLKLVNIILLVLLSYHNCSLAKYMEKHKIRPDTKEFTLVSGKINFKSNLVLLNIRPFVYFLVDKAFNNGPC